MVIWIKEDVPTCVFQRLLHNTHVHVRLTVAVFSRELSVEVTQHFIKRNTNNLKGEVGNKRCKEPSPGKNKIPNGFLWKKRTLLGKINLFSSAPPRSLMVEAQMGTEEWGPHPHSM